MDKNEYTEGDGFDDGGADAGPSDAGDTEGSHDGGTRTQDGESNNQDDGGRNNASADSTDDDTTPDSSDSKGSKDTSDTDAKEGAGGNPFNLPPGHETGVWYQKVDGKWISTGLSDARDLGLGEYVKEDDDGTTSIHVSGDPNTEPTQPEKPTDPGDGFMGNYTSARPQTSQDVQGIPGGKVVKGTTVYEYASADDLPWWLQAYKDGGVDGDYTVIPVGTGRVVWKAPEKPRKHSRRQP